MRDGRNSRTPDEAPVETNDAKGSNNLNDSGGAQRAFEPGDGARG